MTPKEKAIELRDWFKGIVYPYMGSGMLTNTKNEWVILKNARTCAYKVAVEALNSAQYKAHLDEQRPEVYTVEFWQQVKQEIENL